MVWVDYDGQDACLNTTRERRRSDWHPPVFPNGGRASYPCGVTPNAGRYVVLQRMPTGDWRLVREVDRQPGLPARRSRKQAIREALGREPVDGEVFAVLPRSEWMLGLDH